MKDLAKILNVTPPAPPSQSLLDILAGPTSLSSSGYPIISEPSFTLFLNTVPHLFKDGIALLNWLNTIKRLIESSAYPMRPDEASVLRTIEVLKTVTRTANVTAPTDLWLLRQVLSTYQHLGILAWFVEHRTFSTAELLSQFRLHAGQVQFDLDLLHSRGYLEKLPEGQYRLADLPQTQSVFSGIRILDKEQTVNWVPLFQNLLEGSATPDTTAQMGEFLKPPEGATLRQGWVPSLFELEYGYRLVPLVLSLRKLGLSAKLALGKKVSEVVSQASPSIEQFLEQGGLVNEKGAVTVLGERIFARGPGPFGIIYAYQAYLNRHEDLLRGDRQDIWVARGENVAASKDANAKTFALINESLDRYAKKHGFKFNVFIEHAVGYGEATRQRFQKDGEGTIQYFGADLEDAAINRAVELQVKGELPRNMKFIRQADIGDPQKLIRGIKEAGFDVANAVMVVGNGFHEIRKQTNEKMIEVFRAYCEAKITLIFTEESALTSEDLLATGWNTYHAGFRYTHAISGQELRPVYDVDVAGKENPVFSWEKCVTRAGYQLLREFSTHTRTIYPHRRPDGRNPAISVNYFCVPQT